MAVVLKLGGSVITRKGEPETLDRESLAACARAIAADDDALVLVHGGGSFGHYHAERHGVSVTTGTADARAVFEVHGSMRTLNDHVVAALHDHDVPAVGLEPLSLAHRDADRELSVQIGGVSMVLDHGFVPVLFGDLVPHAGEGFTVVSGDELVVALASALGASRVGLCSGVPGVLDAEGDVIDRIESRADAADALDDSSDVDVTGGMAGKVSELLGLPMPASIFGLEDLSAFLAGEDVGTRIDGSAATAGTDEDA